MFVVVWIGVLSICMLFIKSSSSVWCDFVAILPLSLCQSSIIFSSVCNLVSACVILFLPLLCEHVIVIISSAN